MPPTATTCGDRSACRRTSSRRRGRPWWTRWSAGCRREDRGRPQSPAPGSRSPRSWPPTTDGGGLADPTRPAGAGPGGGDGGDRRAAVGPAVAGTARPAALLPVHILGYPADVPALERLGRPIVEDACEALGAVHADGSRVGARGHPAVFGFYANKQLTTGEGGMVTVGDAALKERIDSERNQGRAPDMDWLDHDRLGFNYRLSDLACALGLAQLDRLDGLPPPRARVADAYRE